MAVYAFFYAIYDFIYKSHTMSNNIVPTSSSVIVDNWAWIEPYSGI